jgi:hypothetical protein
MTYAELLRKGEHVARFHMRHVGGGLMAGAFMCNSCGQWLADEPTVFSGAGCSECGAFNQIPNTARNRRLREELMRDFC